MTYTTTYEFTAFAEKDLAEDGHLGCGDKFTMPAGATVCIEVTDNDAFLSGDNKHNENANDTSYQTASITGPDGHELGNGGQIYAEAYWWVHDSDGNWYVMIEVEQEGTGDDYFTFYTGHGYDVPAAGTDLTVHSACNVTSNWIDFKCISAGLKWELDDTCTYTIEAEDLSAWNFKTVHGDNASGNELVKITGHDGKLGADFGGESGTYDIKIHAQDEKDGVSKIIVKVNGHAVGTVMLDEQNNGWGSNNGHFSEFVIDGIQIEKGDKVELLAWKDGGEYVRIDKIAFTQVKDEPGWIKGRLTYDADCNDNEWNDLTGKWDAGVEGQIVQLVDLDGNVIAESTTDHYGNYMFDVAPGDYKVKFPQLDGFKFSAKDSGVAEHFDSDANPDGLTDVIHVASGQTIHNVDAGIKPDFRVCDDPDAVNIGFETGSDGTVLVAGDVVSTQFEGVMISAQRAKNNDAANDAMIFDSNNPTGGDSDLATSSQGNILIVSEDNDSSDPDDAIGGTVWFKFDNPAFIHDIKVVDAEEGGKIRLLDANGQLIEEIIIPNGVDGGLQQVIIDVDGVAQIDLTLNGSGAIDDLCYTPGEPPLGSLSGKYFADTDRDGLDNDGVNGIGGIEVVLLDANGDPTGATTTTAGDGSYSFIDLEAGIYGVKFTDPDTGRELTTQNVDGDASDDIDSDASDVGGGMSTITGIEVVAGENTPDNDAGVVELLGSIGDKVFFDTDRDGIQDAGEQGVDGVTVTLTSAGADGILGNADDTTDSQVTQNGGMYLFDDLSAGDYKVTFSDLPDGTEFTVANNETGTDGDAGDSDADPTTGMTGTISLAAGEDNLTVDAGIVAQLGALSGRYFCDEDRDDTENDGNGGFDVGVGGKRVELFTAAGAFVAFTTTSATGDYRFEDLEAGNYYVEFEDSTLDGKAFVAPNEGGNDTEDSDVIDPSNGRSETVAVMAGEETKNLDAGVVELLGSIGDKVFFDTDRDGIQDAGEQGVDGVTVTLTSAGADGILGNADDTTDSQVTQNGGMYLFDDLSAGDYKVTFSDLPDGTEFTVANNETGTDGDAGDSDADPTTGMTGTISLAAGEDNLTVDAGIVAQLGSISGRYFCDENDNDLDDGQGTSSFGNQNGTEAPVPEQIVVLLDANGAVVTDANGLPIFTTTDSNGEYIFRDVPAGQYKVGFAPVAGKSFVAPDANNNGNDDIDSDVLIVEVPTNVGDLDNDNDDEVVFATDIITLVAGEDKKDVDAGIEKLNAPVVPVPDTAEVCDGEMVVIDVLANDGDDDNDALDVVSVTGAGVDGVLGTSDDVTTNFADTVDNTVTLNSGATVTKQVDGTLKYDVSGADDFDSVLIGSEAADQFIYTVTDGNGSTASAEVDVTVKGALNTVDTIAAELADAGCVTASVTLDTSVGGTAFDLDFEAFDTPNARLAQILDGLNGGGPIDLAFCLSIATPIEPAPTSYEFSIDVLDADSYLAAAQGMTDVGDFPNGATSDDGGFNSENVDNVNWLLNEAENLLVEGFSQGNIQRAIWNLLDGGENDVLEGDASNSFFAQNAQYDTAADALELTNRALTDGEDFVAGSGDVIGLILDPKLDGVQPFVVGVQFDDLEQDCFC